MLQLKSSNDRNKTIHLPASAMPIVLYRVGSTDKYMLGLPYIKNLVTKVGIKLDIQKYAWHTSLRTAYI